MTLEEDGVEEHILMEIVRNCVSMFFSLFVRGAIQLLYTYIYMYMYNENDFVFCN